MSNFKLFNASEFLMNTRFEMVAWGVNSKISTPAFTEAVNAIKKLELVLSFYDPHSETFLMNKTCNRDNIKVSTQLWTYLLLAQGYADKTYSFFNVALGNAFNNLKKGIIAPDIKHLTFNEMVKLDSETESVKFLDADVAIDFGGIGKGIALSETEKILRKYKIENVFISFGESSILTRGRHPHGDYWPFSLKGFRNDFELKLNDDTVSVSNANRSEDSTGRHILNPKNIGSKVGEGMVIVKSPNPIDAEVLSTALIAAPIENHKAIIENFSSANVYIY